MHVIGLAVLGVLLIGCAAPGPGARAVAKDGSARTVEAARVGDPLDALLAAPPSEANFGALRKWLEGQPAGAGRDALIARAEAGLAAWPDATRWAPDEWLYALAAGEVHPLWPLIRRVDATFLDEQKLLDMIQRPAMATVTDLRVRTWSGKAKVIEAVFTAPHLAAVTGLDLAALGPEAARALLQSPMRARLKRLALALDEASAAALASDAALRGLVELELKRLPGSSGATVVASPHLQRLQALRIASASEATVMALAARFPELRRLSLSSASISEAAARALIGARFFAGLEELDLSYASLDQASAVLLAKHIGPRLRVLDVSSARFGDAAIVALAAGEHPQLVELRLRSQRLGREGALALVRAPGLAKLRADGFHTSGQFSRAELLELLASPRLAGHPQQKLWRYHSELLDLSLKPDEAKRPIPADARFVLFRPAPYSPWRGSTLTIDATGQVHGRYQDDHHTEKVTERSGRVKPEVVQALVAAARRAQFFSVQPGQERREWNCEKYDMQSGPSHGFLTVTLDGVTRSLNLSTGCFEWNHGAALRELADRIELLAEMSGTTSPNVIHLGI